MSAPRLYVLAGVNGAGKSSIAGAMIRASGGDYYNPDEAARALMEANPALPQARANAMAWLQGTRLLRRAIDERLDFAMETTLGGSTIANMLIEAAEAGYQVRIFYVGLATPELHIARVRQRVDAGGHDIPEIDIRRRWRHSRLNLIRLLPHLAELRVYDNSQPANPAVQMPPNPAENQAPQPVLLLHLKDGRIAEPQDLTTTPQWAKPIVAAALKGRA